MRISVRLLFAILLFTAIFGMTLRPIADPDFWWHLRTGELIVESGSIPHSDPFSFTQTGKQWVAHEWLTEVLFYRIFQVGGTALLILCFSTIIAASFWFIYRNCVQESRPYAAGFALLLGALATAPTWGVRPQMITFLLTSVTLFLLERYRQNRDWKYILPLPFLVLLWVNMHAGDLTFFMIAGIYTLDELWTYLSARNHRLSPSAIPVLSLGTALSGSLLASLINPNGYHILVYPFETLTSPSMQQFIQEWFSPDFHQVEWQPFAWFLLAMIALALAGRKPIRLTRILLAVLTGYAGLMSMRNAPIFIAVATPILAEQISALFKFQPKPTSAPRATRWMNPLLSVLALLAVSLQYVVVLQKQPLRDTS